MGSIGERILKLRKELNLNQKELADLIGITDASLSRYENNLREPKAEIIIRISEVLQCSTDYLLGRTDNRVDYGKIVNDGFGQGFYSSREYTSFETSIKSRLLNEDLIDINDNINIHIIDKVVRYGIEATIEILKLERQLKND